MLPQPSTPQIHWRGLTQKLSWWASLPCLPNNLDYYISGQNSEKNHSSNIATYTLTYRQHISIHINIQTATFTHRPTQGADNPLTVALRFRCLHARHLAAQCTVWDDELLVLAAPLDGRAVGAGWQLGPSVRVGARCPYSLWFSVINVE